MLSLTMRSSIILTWKRFLKWYLTIGNISLSSKGLALTYPSVGTLLAGFNRYCHDNYYLFVFYSQIYYSNKKMYMKKLTNNCAGNFDCVMNS